MSEERQPVSPIPPAGDAPGRTDANLDSGSARLRAQGIATGGLARSTASPQREDDGIHSPISEGDLREYLRAIIANDLTPTYEYSGSPSRRRNREGRIPEAGRWDTPREIARAMLRRLDQENAA